MTILINLFLALEVIVALLMILFILMQRPKSEGLGAAFGGGVTENIFGAQTTNVLTTITTWLAAIFFALTLALSILYAHRSAPDSEVRRELMKAKAALPAKPTASVAPKAPADLSAKPAGTVAPIEAPASPRPEDAAVGIVPPGSAPLAPSAAPKSAAQPTP
jgi:preprotein translocase subunit SecG